MPRNPTTELPAREPQKSYGFALRGELPSNYAELPTDPDAGRSRLVAGAVPHAGPALILDLVVNVKLVPQIWDGTAPDQQPLAAGRLRQLRRASARRGGVPPEPSEARCPGLTPP